MALRDMGSLVCVYHYMQQVGLARSELGNQEALCPAPTERLAFTQHGSRPVLPLRHGDGAQQQPAGLGSKAVRAVLMSRAGSGGH